jgi:ribosomal protein S18 acetylase RimI-like enzyme
MLKITPANPEDAELVASLVRESFRKQAEILGINAVLHPNYVAFETEGAVRRRMASGAHVALAHLAHEVVGTVSCFMHNEGRHGEVLRRGVVPAYRGRGLGLELMVYAENYLMKRGASTIELGIVADFLRLRGYYERLGYVVTSTRPVGGLPFEVTCLEKHLQERHTT